MDVIGKVAAQIATVGLPLFAVTLTAIPRANTPMLLMLHWHGFRRTPERPPPGGTMSASPVPGSALQINERWDAMEVLDEAMLQAAWQLGAWELDREERRACSTIGASDREALECRQAFGDHPYADASMQIVAEAPDRPDMMELGSRVGYVRWQFRPVHGGGWAETAEDDSLLADGRRTEPCPYGPKALVGTRTSRTRYRLGRIDKIIVL